MKITHLCYSKTSTTNKQKENPRIPWNVKFSKQVRLQNAITFKTIL